MDRNFLESMGISDEIAERIIERSNEEISRLQLLHSAENELEKRGAKNINAAMRLLNLDDLSFADGMAEGLSERIDGFMKENDFLFEENRPKPVFAGAADNGGEQGIKPEEFAKMGYIKRLNLFKNNPDVYKTLTE